MPSDFWRNFFDNAEREIGMLVYSGLFASEDAGIQRIFREKDEGPHPRPRFTNGAWHDSLLYAALEHEWAALS